MSKITDILGDIIHTACVAECSSDEEIQKQALGDIYDAIASVLPVDHGKKAKGEGEGEGVAVYKTPQHILDFIAEIANVPFADMADPALLKKVAETHHLVPNKGADGMTGFNKFLTAAEGVRFVRFSGNGETRLVARRIGANDHPNAIFEIRVDHEEDYATVFRDAELMFTIKGMSIGHSFVEKLAISSMHRYFKENRSTNEKKKRKRARIAAAREDAGREGTPGTGEEG